MQLMMKILILTIGLMTLSSCITTQTINQRYPIIPIPKRPKISSALDKDDFKAMVRYATKLETGIKNYNEYATEENKKIDQYFENR